MKINSSLKDLYVLATPSATITGNVWMGSAFAKAIGAAPNALYVRKAFQGRNWQKKNRKNTQICAKKDFVSQREILFCQ